MSAVAVVTRERVRRRTACGDARAEARIEADLADVAGQVEEELGEELRALLLVGSYARGEGGAVRARDGGLGPYNDYDLVAIVREHAAAALRAPLLALARRLSEEREIEVDLWPVDESSLASLPPTLFWLDVSLGGVEVVCGDPLGVDHLRRIKPRDVPHAEAARLLMNRAVGLALSNLEREDEDLRRARHAHKAVLACGDALLLAADLYAPTVAARASALDRQRPAPRVGDALADAYRDAALFRARPDEWRAPAGESLERWYVRTRALVASRHLAYEAARVGSPPTPAGYAASQTPLFGDAPDLSPGWLAAVRAWWRRQAPLIPFVGHPRERLARVAVALAYGHASAGCRAIAARLLGVEPEATDDELHRALRTLTEVAG